MPPNPDFFHHDPSLSIPPPPVSNPTPDNGTAGLRPALQAQPRRDQLSCPSVSGRVAFDRDALLLLEAQGMDLTAAEHAIAYPAAVAARPNRFLRAVDGFIGRPVRSMPGIPTQTWAGACCSLAALVLLALLIGWLS